MGDKIKFGFSKVIKKPNLLPQNGSSAQEKSKIELINEIEGSSIKIAGKDPADDKESKLIIPMTNDQKRTPLAKLLAQKRLKNLVGIKAEAENGYETLPKETPAPSPMDVDIKQEPIDETLEQQAARELIEDLQSKAIKSETKIFEVPINPDELPLEGAKESSIDDYERVPISDFGKAMLRGMGWKEEEKKEDSKPWLDAPVQRPKGMGLGADKVIKKQALLIAPNQSETLEVKKNACIKVLAGKHKNLYGTIEGFDDGGGRVIVRLAIGGMKVTMNEFMVQVVGKAEFAKYGKILNSEKYEEFKSNEDGNKTSVNSVKTRDEPETSRRGRDRSPVRSRKSSKTPEKRRSSRTPERRKKSRSRNRSRSRERNGNKSSHRSRYENASDVRKYRGRSRSRDKHSRRSSSSDERSHKKKSNKHKKHYSSSPDSRYSSGDERKHKKKTKKSKHRKRDRS